MKLITKLFLSLFFFLTLVSPLAYAQEVTGITLPTQAITPTPIPQPTAVNYELPYPGLLPGSPLYLLKSFRDKVLEILISDQLKKSNFYLLQADKRLSASLALFDLNKDVLAETTLSKGQNYLEKSLGSVVLAKKSQKNISEILDKIKMSSEKQKEEIGILIKRTKGDTRERLTGDFKRAETLQKNAEQIKP